MVPQTHQTRPRRRDHPGQLAKCGCLTADHLALLDAAVTALPPGFRRKLMVTCDGAGASHALVARLDTLAGRRGYAACCRMPGSGSLVGRIDSRGPVLARKVGRTCLEDGRSGCSMEIIFATIRFCNSPYELVYSVGWVLGEREKTALRLVPEQAWQIAIDGRGEVRERRADEACADCCWTVEPPATRPASRAIVIPSAKITAQRGQLGLSASHQPL